MLGLSSAAPRGSWKGVGLEEEGQGLKLLLPRVMLALQVAGQPAGLRCPPIYYYFKMKMVNGVM